MLTQLSIRNIVLIESCEVPFGPGLCVLTGETGAGKSILLDALGLALGARADVSLIRHGEAQGHVTAEFDIAGNEPVQALFAELDLEPADSLIIRRYISRDGKTRCLANDAPISVSGLRRLGEALVEIHGQHDQRGLLSAATHRSLLDHFGRHAPLLHDVQDAYIAWRNARSTREALETEIATSGREEEWLKHITQELARLDPKPGEEEHLTEQRTQMMQSEKLFETLNDAMKEISGIGSGKGASAALRAAQRILLRSPLSSTPRFAPVLDALDKAAELADQAHDALETLGQEAPYDAQKLETIEERLFALKAAGRKYNLTVEELPGLREEADAKLARLVSRDKELAAARIAEKEAKAQYQHVAEALSHMRKKTAATLEAAVQVELAPLHMSNARFQVRSEPLEEPHWSTDGMDAITFEAATNAGSKDDAPFAPIHKIASGGELSRFMLALKVALSETRATSTLIFDEIDTGTGGAVADAIGSRLAALAKTAQILVVTHLPQVAARGAHHLKIQKRTLRGDVKTAVQLLAPAEREEELARMLAGRDITPEARRAAQKLLEQAT